MLVELLPVSSGRGRFAGGGQGVLNGVGVQVYQLGVVDGIRTY
jgi:hypothetical protein